MAVSRPGDRGPVVAEIRAKLVRVGTLAVPQTDPGDEFDAATDRAVREFQQRRGLRVDGLVGPETYRALEEAHWRFGDRLLSYAVSRPAVGDDVAILQQRLIELGFDPGRCDGIFGAHTDAALRDFQRNVGLAVDGQLGPATLRALAQLRRTVTGGSVSDHREEERLRRAGTALSGRVVVLDPGHGGADAGLSGHGLEEADTVLDIATRIEGRLGALGVTTFLTRNADTSRDDRDRARFANEVDADLLISLHLDAAASPRASGAACYFYGASLPDRTVRSVVGERLAALIQREVVSRTDLVDGRSHPKSWELLRMTRMPAVRLDVGYLTNEGDAGRLALAEFRDAVAEAVVAAVQRLYLPEHLDVPTGQFRIPALSR